MKRRAAVEPVIGHLKAEHCMGRNHLAQHAGDAVNAVLAAVGYNFRLLLNWLRLLMRAFPCSPSCADQTSNHMKIEKFTGIEFIGSPTHRPGIRLAAKSASAGQPNPEQGS